MVRLRNKYDTASYYMVNHGTVTIVRSIQHYAGLAMIWMRSGNIILPTMTIRHPAFIYGDPNHSGGDDDDPDD